MSTPNICRYIYTLAFSLLLLLGALPVYAQAGNSTDTTAATPKVKKKDLAGHQLTLSVDLVHPVINHYTTDHFGYEFQADYYLKNEYYVVAEGGWGASTVDYIDLKYTTSNNFFRAGFNKEILTREKPNDWDMMFFGIRAGYAGVTRSNATYVITDSLWGSSTGSTAGKDFPAVWLELVGGMRVELVKGLSAGWTARGKFIMNGKSFNDLAPLYIAGYGKGDKNTNFDANVYITYAIRWKRKSNGAITK